MTEGIFLIQKGGQVVEMNSQPYASEDKIQELLADHPSLIVGYQIDPDAPRRWLLVSREMRVPGEEDGASRWSVDHLSLDQDGIPTIVEVKRCSDTRIRREVVGQMLDYAANAVVYWPIEEIQRRFSGRCEAQGKDPDSELQDFIGNEADADEFWTRVKTNLQAGKVRLIFVADSVPPELQRVVEFLNSQMDMAEVLALEVKQYVAGEMKTIVPRVLGQTAESHRKKSGTVAARKWDEASFFADLREKKGEGACAVARQILDWTKSNATRLWWGSGKLSGSFGGAFEHNGVTRYLFAVFSYGTIEIYFQWLKNNPPFDDEGKRREFARRVNEVPGIKIPEDALKKRPSIPLEVFEQPGHMTKFLGVFDWALGEIRAVES